MQCQIDTGPNIFFLKVKLAIAANIIDFGKHANLTECEVQACFNTALGKSIDEDVVVRLSEVVQSADRVLFLCDNAGEIVFDRYLIQEMPMQKITCAVRGAPAINDAILEDARVVGLTDLVKVISNGSDIPGTVLEACSPEFKKTFYDADVVIAKGQGNFETLSEITDKRIFFLLQVKCPVIARDIGFPVGTFVIKDNLACNH
jgi:damage-control phosphatase, subfamily I